ncbi:cbb3-type cytochrome oxidase assembly protein CcoS [Dyella sp. BiH032]|uniref:cbb3-type cytochrome oxidase assembly protein CcoS n=1 Tax=Dyella sp. BiH032 TaxID=3075430 RepID=UPI002893087A|nr:cbb3-type cytochrome oxidase assembly protein CcoS [Dyella sp. BiH032]WNL44593.1 cbb3-type cytochrome oxidase assembly protein CcoS [Dyella sp. BiH032]
MTTMLILIPLTFLLLLVAGAAFFWAVNHDQFDDMDSAKLLPLTDHARESGQDPPSTGTP